MAGRKVNYLLDSVGRVRIGINEERIDPLLNERAEGCLDIAGVGSFQDDELATSPGRCLLNISYVELKIRIGRVGKETDHTGRGYEFVHQIELFCRQNVSGKFTPVILPPGRLMLATRPDLTGSLPVKNTIGIVAVAALAARDEAVSSVAITATVGQPDWLRMQEAVRIGRAPTLFDRHVRSST